MKASIIEGKFTVYVDDNFHFMDESERYKLGEFDTYDEALSVSKKIVDDYLESAYKPGMTADELCHSHAGFGEDPFIVPDKEQQFSSKVYARERASVMCQ